MHCPEAVHVLPVRVPAVLHWRRAGRWLVPLVAVAAGGRRNTRRRSWARAARRCSGGYPGRWRILVSWRAGVEIRHGRPARETLLIAAPGASPALRRIRPVRRRRGAARRRLRPAGGCGPRNVAHLPWHCAGRGEDLRDVPRRASAPTGRCRCDRRLLAEARPAGNRRAGRRPGSGLCPHRQLPGLRVPELDVAAVLDRRPELALVDEHAR